MMTMMMDLEWGFSYAFQRVECLMMTILADKVEAGPAAGLHLLEGLTDQECVSVTVQSLSDHDETYLYHLIVLVVMKIP